MDLHTSIRQSSIWMVARLGISLTVGAFVTTYVIRSLTVEEYGIYNVLYSMIGYVSVVASFGIPEVFRRFIPEALQKKEYGIIKGLVVRGLKLRMLLSIVTVSVILLLHGPVGRLLKLDDFLSYFSIFAFSIILALEAGLMTSVLHSLFLHKYSVIASTIYTVFRGVCVFALLQSGWGIRGVLIAELISWGLWTGLQWFFYHAKFARLHPAEKKTSLPLRRYFRYGGYSSLNELGSSVLGVSTDFFIITAFLGPGSVALYAFASRVVRMFVSCMPHVVLIDVIRPTFFTKYAESGNKQHLCDMFNLLVKIGAFCVFPLAAGLFVLGEQVITIVFKPDYLAAKHILWLIIVFNAINIFAQPSGLVLKAIERVEIIFYSRVFSVYNLVTELIIIHWFGVMGVVLVTCSANFMMNVYQYHCAKRYASVRVDWRGLIRIALNAALMAFAVWPLKPFATNFVLLSLIVGYGFVLFIFISWINKAFSRQERIWINRLTPRAVFVF